MKCAVLGDPIDHSLSPVLHRAGYAVSGLDWTYEAVQVPAGGLESFLASLGDEWRGLSLTMPLKREAMALATSVSSRAAQAGAANTLVRGEDGWHGDNTDIPGAAAAIRERYDGALTAGTILGAGATAASVGLALADLGATRLTILARDPARAAETVAVLSAHPNAPEVVVGFLDAPEVTGEVVVSTIPAAAQTGAVVAACAETPVLFEVVYDPWPTPLAAAASGVLIDGLDLLSHQAALQFSAFTGVIGSVDVLRDAGRAALASGER